MFALKLVVLYLCSSVVVESCSSNFQRNDELPLSDQAAEDNETPEVFLEDYDELSTTAEEVITMSDFTTVDDELIELNFYEEVEPRSEADKASTTTISDQENSGDFSTFETVDEIETKTKKSKILTREASTEVHASEISSGDVTSRGCNHDDEDLCKF